MNQDKLPLYDECEQGLTDDDLDEVAAVTAIRQERHIRNQVSREALISQLNTDEESAYGAAETPTSGDGDKSEPSVIPRLAIYLRVSTEEQARIGGEAEGYSIPSQRDACLAKVRAMGGIVAEEYVEAGESAKSADRPELQRMLRDLKPRRIDYVLVHKIDRLARNRADDVAINASIARAGAKLLSVSEPVDDTPAGRLLYNMMADVAQYHSDNLAVEVLKGMNKKAQLGGTPYRAPLGYLNKTELRDGVRVAWIEIDPERGPLVRWLLEEYATGEWTVRQLAIALENKGLRSRGTRKSAPRPVVAQTIHRLLKNPYYFGVVPYRGVYHEGKHQPLVSAKTWLVVQDVLKAHNVAGEKTRKHPHYLKGTIFCGECGSRLVFSRNRGNGGIYDYFMCLNRKTRRGTCSRTVTRLEKIEMGVASFYGSFQVHPHHVESIRTAVQREVTAQRKEASETSVRAARKLRAVKDEREKLLQAYYAGAIPADLLKVEMDRFTREMTAAEQELADATQSVRDSDATLERALIVAGACERHYVAAQPRIRRQINQGLFTALYIGRDGGVERYELTEPFAQLLEPSLGCGEGAQDSTKGSGNRERHKTDDSRVRPSSVLTATFDAPDTKIVQKNLLDGGLHMGRLVPPVRLERTLRPF